MGIVKDRKEKTIIIIDKTTGKPLGLPVRPIDDSAAFTDGEKQATTVTILDVGTVDIPAGVDLDQIGWSSFFPGKHDPHICDVTAAGLKAPEIYRNRFSGWKDAGTPLQLIWPWAGLNKTVYLKTFTWKPPNAMGDIFYDVAFRELKTLAPKKISTKATRVSKSKSPESRSAVPKKNKPKGKTYTVKSGDTLTGIAKRLGITPWRTKLYEPNKKVIGPNPSKLKAGQVLKI
ncbi:LysM peptidoglycan-binding domain-containing protein [Paenibacillus agilis]|uniref:LysM peptidoglycan-binding domain-containing protein n=1 Tax=Paenibacillus agilis TaxID=3020863 RepID=A0A559IX99_9BACL|nr:LysM peptidoglycan-binding domain-containing protein [Paenibacillus agilis]TVX92226.1 LysM peptidoglycan-binding domain-containing protein [Paenibacillus agilis]